MRNRNYLWIATGIAAGAGLALVMPGLDLAFGMAIGTAIGIAWGADGDPHRRRADHSSNRAAERRT